MTTQPSPIPAGPSAGGLGRVGDWTLLAKIGEGGMGVVHLARRDEAPGGPGAPAGAERGQRAALKVLRPHVVGDDEARERLAREVRSLERVRSRWVAEIVDADPWGPVPWVATRYVPGLSLHDHVAEEGPVTGRDLSWFAACLAEGVAAVHGAGVLHRDIKPSNVVMEGRSPILIDFGLARVADDPKLTMTGWLLGTPGYLPPEILHGDDATPASDVHSWAATVAYAATGRPPFGRGPAMAIMDRVRRGEHDLTGVPDSLRDVLVAALHPEPEERPSLDALLAWLRPQTTEASVAPPERLTPAPADLTLPYAAAAAAGAVGAVGAAGHQPTRVEGVDDAPTRVDGWDDRDWEDREAEPTRLFTAHGWGEPDRPHELQEPEDDSEEWQEEWPEPVPPPRPRVPVAERFRRALLLLGLGVLVAIAALAAPYLTAAALVVLVWLLRSGSLAASAVGLRRERRGRRWYDGPLLLLGTPWDLVRSIPGTALLVLWSAGLAAAAALLCYAFATGAGVTLLVTGFVLGVALFSGPGGSRVRGPVGRVVAPLSRRTGRWLLSLVLVLGVSGLALWWVADRGIIWAPDQERPFAGVDAPRVPSDLPGLGDLGRLVGR